MHNFIYWYLLIIYVFNPHPGVHQKALETYDIIFKCMGTNRLAAELFIYSAGTQYSIHADCWVPI